VLLAVDRFRKDTLSYAPVDLLVLGDLSPERLHGWLIRVKNTEVKPKLILEFWDPYWVLKETGPMAKRTITKWSCEGYQTTCPTLNGLQVGGVVDWSWLIVERIPADALNGWAWPHFPEPVTQPMSNCLWPTGVPWLAYHSSPKHQDSPIPHADEDSMPARLGSFIRTDPGTRHLLHDQFAKGLGALKIWLGDCIRRGVPCSIQWLSIFWKA
jgi:hypothetical protein